MFFFDLTYVKPLEEVERVLPDHIRYLNTHYQAGHFLCSGRKVPRTGGVILCSFPSREAAEEAMRQDPFYREGIAQYTVTEFLITKSSDAFRQMMEAMEAE